MVKHDQQAGLRALNAKQSLALSTVQAKISLVKSKLGDYDESMVSSGWGDGVAGLKVAAKMKFE